jgi:hypothetical protein
VEQAERPAGITILAGVMIIWGLLELLIAVPTLIAVTVFGGITADRPLGATMLVTGALWLILGLGTYTLRRWAWLIGLVMTGVGLIQAIWGIFAGPGLCVGIAGLIVPGLILYYLLRPEVRAAFGQT